MNELAKILIVSGLFLLAFGILALVFGKIPGIGKIPGDIYIRKGNFSFYFPLATSLLISLILTVVISLFRKKP